MFADCVKVTSKKKRRKRKVKGDETSKKSLHVNHNKIESRIVENNRRGDQSRRLYIGDKVLLRQHPPGRNKIQPRYQDNMFAVVSTPEIGGTYVVKDDVTQQTRVVAGAEMRRYLPRKAADVVVDPAAGERDDFTAEEDGDPAVGVGDNRPADVDVDPAVGVDDNRAADVGVDPAVGRVANRTADVGVDPAIGRVADRQLTWVLTQLLAGLQIEQLEQLTWVLTQLLAGLQIEQLTWVLTQLFSWELMEQLMWVLVGRCPEQMSSPRVTLSLRPGSQHRVNVEMATVWVR